MSFETSMIDLLKEYRTILPNQIIRKSPQKNTVKTYSKYLTVLLKNKTKKIF